MAKQILRRYQITRFEPHRMPLPMGAEVLHADYELDGELYLYTRENVGQAMFPRPIAVMRMGQELPFGSWWRYVSTATNGDGEVFHVFESTTDGLNENLPLVGDQRSSERTWV